MYDNIIACSVDDGRIAQYYWKKIIQLLAKLHIPLTQPGTAVGLNWVLDAE